MKRIIDALAALGVLWALLVQSPLAHAQQPVYPGSYSTPANGNGLAFVPYSASNPLPVTGTFSATLGGFTPATRGTPIAVTTADSSGALPAGAVVVASNVGSNPMYCNANGIAATTSDQLITASGGWFAFTIPNGVTTLHCIATGGATTANMVGGAGLPTGTGGGGGGGAGGTVAQGTGGASAWLVTGAGGVFPATQSGTWTVQPGNTANTTPWLASISQGGNTATVDASSNLHVAAQGVSAGTSAGSVTGSVVMCDPVNTLPAYSNGLVNWNVCDLNGKLSTIPYSINANDLRGSGSSTTTAAITVLAAAGASLNGYLTDIFCTRSDAGTTAITVTLNDANSTAFDVPDNGGGGGFSHTFNVPLVSSATNTAITATPSAGVTTLHCSGTGYKGT